MDYRLLVVLFITSTAVFGEPPQYKDDFHQSELNVVLGDNRFTLYSDGGSYTDLSNGKYLLGGRMFFGVMTEGLDTPAVKDYVGSYEKIEIDISELSNDYFKVTYFSTNYLNNSKNSPYLSKTYKISDRGIIDINYEHLIDNSGFTVSELNMYLESAIENPGDNIEFYSALEYIRGISTLNPKEAILALENMENRASLDGLVKEEFTRAKRETMNVINTLYFP